MSDAIQGNVEAPRAQAWTSRAFERITDEDIRIWAQNQKLTVGMTLEFEIRDQANTRLLHSCSFRVTVAGAQYVTTMRGDDPHSGERWALVLDRVGDWIHYDETGHAKPPAESFVKWNLGKKKFERVVDGRVVGEFDTREEAEVA